MQNSTLLVKRRTSNITEVVHKPQALRRRALKAKDAGLESDLSLAREFLSPAPSTKNESSLCSTHVDDEERSHSGNERAIAFAKTSLPQLESSLSIDRQVRQGEESRILVRLPAN